MTNITYYLRLGIVQQARATRIGDVTVRPLPDGVMSMRPRLLYPDVPESNWRSMAGTIDEDGWLQVPFGGFLAIDVHVHRLTNRIAAAATDNPRGAAK